MLKFVMLRSCKTFHLILFKQYKLNNNLISNPRGGSLALTAKKLSKRLEKKQVKKNF